MGDGFQTIPNDAWAAPLRWLEHLTPAHCRRVLFWQMQGTRASRLIQLLAHSPPILYIYIYIYIHTHKYI